VDGPHHANLHHEDDDVNHSGASNATGPAEYGGHRQTYHQLHVGVDPTKIQSSVATITLRDALFMKSCLGRMHGFNEETDSTKKPSVRLDTHS
jgi:hypothetical protein